MSDAANQALKEHIKFWGMDITCLLTNLWCSAVSTGGVIGISLEEGDKLV